MNLQLYSEPANKSGGSGDDNKYLRDGGCDLMAFAEQLCVLIHGYDATLGHVEQILNNRQDMLNHALWVCGRLAMKDEESGETPGKGKQTILYAQPMRIEDSKWVSRHDPKDVENYINYFRGVAAKVADLIQETDNKSPYTSFVTGAQQALHSFNITTRAHKRTKKTSFRFSEQKEGRRATTVFLVVDPTRINAQRPVLGLLQWCMFTELKRHENKQRPVYLIADEATNFKLHDLDTLLTWGRGYGLRIHLILQSFSAFRKVYGKGALSTLLSETEIKQFLAG